MQKITSSVALKLRISELEENQAAEWYVLKLKILEAREGLRPLNILKSTFSDMTASANGKNDLLATAVGVTAGMLSKTVLFGFSANPLKKMVGAIVQLKVANLVSSQTKFLAKVGGSIINLFKKRKSV